MTHVYSICPQDRYFQCSHRQAEGTQLQRYSSTEPRILLTPCLDPVLHSNWVGDERSGWDRKGETVG